MAIGVMGWEEPCPWLAGIDATMIANEEPRWPHVGHFLKRSAVALVVVVVGAGVVAVSFVSGRIGSYQIVIGDMVPMGEKVPALRLQERGFDRICFEPLTDPTIRSILRGNLQHDAQFDLFGDRTDSSRIVYLGGKAGARYALVRELFLDDALANPNADCWPLSRVTIELQPASRYRTEPPRKPRKNTNVEDVYVWMTIDNGRQ